MAIPLMVLKNAFRSRLRSILTIIGIALTIVAFLSLRSMITTWQASAANASADRLVVRNKVSMVFPLPITYYYKIRSLSGVTDATWANWFGGLYKDSRKFFAKFAVDADSYLRVYPEITLNQQEKAAWLADRTGCVVGAALARDYGWKIGDSIPIIGDIYPGNWKFTIRGIFAANNNSYNENTLLFHWKYINEMASTEQKNQAGIFVVRIADPSLSIQVAREINTLFANSPAETRAETEKAFQIGFLSQASAVMAAINLVAGGMLIVLILILTNTMLMAVRERAFEYALMRVIGFRPSHIVLLVLAEGSTISILGAILGIMMTPSILSAAQQASAATMGNLLSGIHTEPKLVAISVSVALFGSMIATAVPAWRAGKVALADALRRIE